MPDRTHHATIGTSASSVTIGDGGDLKPAAVYEVVSVDGAGAVSWRIDGETAVASTDPCDTIPAVAGAASSQRKGKGPISLIATANTAVVIRAID